MMVRAGGVLISLCGRTRAAPESRHVSDGGRGSGCDANERAAGQQLAALVRLPDAWTMLSLVAATQLLNGHVGTLKVL